MDNKQFTSRQNRSSHCELSCPYGALSSRSDVLPSRLILSVRSLAQEVADSGASARAPSKMQLDVRRWKNDC